MDRANPEMIEIMLFLDATGLFFMIKMLVDVQSIVAALLHRCFTNVHHFFGMNVRIDLFIDFEQKVVTKLTPKMHGDLLVEI